jgi:hypothetical protein
MSKIAAAALWQEWGRLTRFLNSARIAFAREADIWDSLQIQGKNDVVVEVTRGHRTFTAKLDQHLDALRDEEILLTSVLIHSYALAEAAAADELGADIRGIRIEDWGKRLLSANGKGWSSVTDGLGGAVEVSVVRNVLAHGRRSINQTAHNRLTAANVNSRPKGSAIALSFDDLATYRARLRSLLSTAGIRA